MLIASPVFSFDQPAVNMGSTSFLDGAPAPAGPGLYFQDYVQYYKSDRLKDANGNRLALPKQETEVLVNLTQFVYQSPQRLLGGSWGVDLLAPWILKARQDDGIGGAALSARDGVGDLTVGPFLQFDPVMGPNGPRFAHRLELDLILPTGSYDRTKSFNPGSNFWSFNPYWAGTYWFSPEWTGSFRTYYLWNAKNTDPNVAFGPGVTSTKAGQAVHANFALDYAVQPNLRIGVNGYLFRQITDSEINGNQVTGRENVWAIGPGAVLSLSKENLLFVNTYFEQDARNRPQGNRLQLRWVHHF